MRLSHFFIDRPIFATVLSIFITLIGGVAYFTLPVAQYPEIAPPTIVVTRQLSRRLGRGRRRHRGDAARAGDQRRREHALHGLAGDRRRQPAAHHHLRARHRSRHRAGARAEPRRHRRAAPAGGGAPHRRDGAQELARPDDGDPPQLARRHRATSSTSPTTRPCRSRTCWPASTASATCASSARATTRCASGSIPSRIAARNLTAGDVVAALQAQNVQVASGVLNQPPVPQARRLPAQRRDPGPAHRPAPVRQHHRQDRPRRPGDAHPRRRPRRARRPGLQRQRLSRRAPGRAAADLPAPRLERARDRRRDLERRWRSWRRISRPACDYDIVYNPTEFIAAVGRRGEEDDLRGRRPRRHRRHPVPADLARLDHPDRRDPGLADRHLRGDGRARLLAQQSVAVRAGAGDRHRRRRRDRRGRERRAQSARRACRRRRRRTARWTRSAAR